MAYEAPNAQHAEDAAVVEIDGKLHSFQSGEERDIPLNRLHLSPNNVRKKHDPSTIPELAAAILAEGGLLNPLAVIPEKIKGSKGDHGVVAGGRRLAALQYLAEHAAVRADVPVRCRVFDAERGVSVSLVENATQEPMHPADQLEAFKRLVDEGRTAGQIAAAYNLTALTVERRLKLARLAPEFLELFRADQIEMGQLQALALADDQDEQRRVWNALPPYKRSPHYITQMLTNDEVSGTSGIALFVGVEAYREAGGAVRADLFTGEEGSFYFQDGALLNRLALEKLEAQAEAVRAAGWKWVEARMSFPYHERSVFGKLVAKRRKPTPQEQEEIDSLKADAAAVRKRLDELDALTACDEETGEEGELTEEQQAESWALSNQLDILNEISGCMEEALREWGPRQRANSGVVVSFDYAGQIILAEGLVRQEDTPQAKQQAAGGDGAVSEPPAKVRPEYSANLCANMTAHRTAAVSASLTQQPKVALAALLMTLIVNDKEPWQSSPVKVSFSKNMHQIGNQAAEYEGSRAAGICEGAADWIDALPAHGPTLFAALLGMEPDELIRLLSVFVARAYEVFSNEPARTPGHGYDMAQLIESSLGIDVADWWTPTNERYLSHVPKAKMIEAVTQACGADAAQPIEKMKKGEAIAATAALLDGRRWLPSTLRPYPQRAEPAAQDEAREEDEGQREAEAQAEGCEA